MKFYVLTLTILISIASSFCNAQNSSLTASADATVYQGDNMRNYGEESKLIVKNKKGSTVSRRFYIKFDLQNSGLKSIKKATLKLYCNNIEIAENSTNTTGLLVDIYAIDANWDESDINWKSGPKSTLKIKSFDANIKKNWIEIDLTEYLKNNFSSLSSLNLLLSNSEGTGNLVEFTSKEGKNKPVLVLE